MDYSNENAPMRGSQLRPPTKITTPSSGLYEMTASDNNSLPEPATKRKTLAERAGEVARPNHAAPPISRPVNSAVMNMAQAGPRYTSNSSFSSSTSTATSRTTSASSRTTSANSLQSGVGGIGRPAANGLRSHSSMSRMRANQQSHNGSRSVSALETHEEISDQPVLGKRKGMLPSYLPSATPETPGSFQSFAQRQRQKSQALTITSGLMKTPTRQARSAQYGATPSNQQSRELSFTSRFNNMSLQDEPDQKDNNVFDDVKFKSPKASATTPSQIPRLAPITPNPIDPPILFEPPLSPTPQEKIQFRSQQSRSASPQAQFLSRYSNTKAPLPAWDTKGRLEDIETLYSNLKTQLNHTAFERNDLEEAVNICKTRSTSPSSFKALVQRILDRDPQRELELTSPLLAIVNELQEIRKQLDSSNSALKSELEDTKIKLSTTNVALDDTRRSHTNEVEDLTRKYRNEMDDTLDRHRKERERLRKEAEDETDGLKKEHRDEVDRLIRQHKEDLSELEARLKAKIDEERSGRVREVQDLSTQIALQQQSTNLNMSNKDREAQEIRDNLQRTVAELGQERNLNETLKKRITEADAHNIAIDSSMRTMKAKIDFLESDNKAQSTAFGDMNKKLQDAIDAMNEAKTKLQAEESLRRKLHNQVQELKGNIRVFCRVRPTIDETESPAKMAYPDAEADGRELQVQGPEQKSAMGKITTATNSFAFDKVFSPSSHNADVFEEISQLVQSALDGYNVCIFCYGQTGSGKTFTMSSPDGMIPRAVTQIYDTAQTLTEKGWIYTMQGSFIEVYNEQLNDLLGNASEFDKSDKHKITHDAAKGTTEISGIQSVVLDSPSRVGEMLARASKNRSVAATKANERSSRSHSVFMLKLTGRNEATGEKSEGTLNLVDLAGSERLAQSQAEGARLKETQSINKSLSCLGDVIGALGQGKEGHVPYRNSKLTYLLQQSLSGNSKTLMFVMISPLQAHLSETLTSLKFATKVHNTHIGTARRQTKA
ncbi:MAG: kinesin-like nuclear fusion protein [Bogoriella megaspora]|nr:MAG: kinesin-like nuclear fusion protein [Bogoriella megaspora]